MPSFKPHPIERFDYLVIGSGLAGLSFALHAAKSGTVAILTKAEVTMNNTSWAQGGIAAAVGESDSWELHEQDTLIAGAGLCDPAAVRFLVQSAPDAIAWLQDLGADFDSDRDKDLLLGREGGHSRHRIVHHRDKTGWEVERAVSEAIRSRPNISLFEYAFATQLIVEDGRCLGAAAMIPDLGQKVFAARATLLATGGCGKVYSHTTNPRVATGDGVYLAWQAGAKVENMEFMQFHPTTLYHDQAPGFLITEAVRGAGGTLRSHKGRRFMRDYDSRLELAPRDVVARSIEREMSKLETWCVYLDATHLDSDMLQQSFPTIWEKLRTLGIEIESDWIPIVPAQHYSCGGVRTDLRGRTTVEGLYASGEAACTGVHGANRLASNSLLEAMVFSKAAAEAAPEEPPLPEMVPHPAEIPCPRESDAIRIRKALQRIMSQHVGVFRTTEGLEEAMARVKKLSADYDDAPRTSFSPYVFETRSLLACARLIVEGALARKENVGLHFNESLASHP
jgi:L-aspartate oxidase